MSRPANVRVSCTSVVLPTYLPAPPDRNPMFLEKRVYQGSSGKVYPLPFTDRIAEKPVDRRWKAVWIENEFLRAMVLPELGGRIHALQDKTNGYELIYHQRVIKPALVGLAGPWISGGIEFNWPQHHRPATFLPVAVEIEKHADGSRTIWCSDHDPMTRMKGMHGVCLHPGKAYLELKVRACNRTPFTQTFLWWANVAVRVHEAYQSFFPPDVHCVADHARRSMSEYPLAKGFYYGVNYGKRGRKGVPPNEIPRQFVPPHCAPATFNTKGATLPDYAANDLSFYANIPVPTSYMCVGSREDFFGGYDHAAQAGIVHIANHYISPGKKQWTWGNHEFGYAWDRNLTDPDESHEFAPYVEIMAGVYTDNQPDFSFLQPGETKTWSQFWYGIQKIGPAQHANLQAAVSLKMTAGRVRLGVAVTRIFPKAEIVLTARGKTRFANALDLAPGRPFITQIELRSSLKETDLRLCVNDSRGREMISYQPGLRSTAAVPPPATEPPPPKLLSSADELFVTGLHLEQYRHATRCPTAYWREALRRDPLDSRCNNAMGLWLLRRGELAPAERHFRRAIQRLTRRNANPDDGEPFYNLGLCLRYQLDFRTERHDSKWDQAYEAFYKATWNQAWASAGYHALAEMDCRRSDWPTALDHLDRSLHLNADNLRARDLKVLVLLRLAATGGNAPRAPRLDRTPAPRSKAGALLRESRRLDPLDSWAQYLSGRRLDRDLQTALDIAHDLAGAGLYREGIELLNEASAPAPHRFDAQAQAAGSGGLNGALPDQNRGALPLVHYTLGWLHENGGDRKAALAAYRKASALPPDYCFPHRLQEIAVLQAAIRANPRDARALYYLGNLFYDRRRHAEAIRLWEKSARQNPGFSVVWRNLGIGYFNILRQPARARRAYDKALRAHAGDARLLYERDQLWKRLGDRPEKRLGELERHPELVRRRDDLSVELCALYNQTGQPERALEILSTRTFQPWEGGEGGPLGQYVRAHLAIGREQLRRGRESGSRSPRSESAHQLIESAAAHFRNALQPPSNLGEARHLLANSSDVHYWLGVALASLGERRQARERWLAAATFQGDFQQMSTRAFSEMTYYSAASCERLGRTAKATRLLRELLAWARALERAPARIDYFATSLPTMLLFEDDPQFRQETTALFLQAQARLGLGQKRRAKALLQRVLRRDPNHGLAADLLAEPFHRKGKP